MKVIKSHIRPVQALDMLNRAAGIAQSEQLAQWKKCTRKRERAQLKAAVGKEILAEVHQSIADAKEREEAFAKLMAKVMGKKRGKRNIRQPAPVVDFADMPDLETRRAVYAFTKTGESVVLASCAVDEEECEFA